MSERLLLRWLSGNRAALNVIGRTGGQTAPKAHEWNDVVIVVQWRLQQSKGMKFPAAFTLRVCLFVLRFFQFHHPGDHSSGSAASMRRQDSL